MTQGDQQQTLAAIHGLLKERADYVEWLDIMAAVSAAVSVRKNGWLAVRGVLQFLLNEGAVERDPNVHVERYRLR